MKSDATAPADDYQTFLWDEPEQQEAEAQKAGSSHEQQEKKEKNKPQSPTVLLKAAQNACSEWKQLRSHTLHCTFYPYAGLKNKIKIEENSLWIRISDILEDAPYEVLYSLIHSLLRKAHRKPVNPTILAFYQNYINQTSVEEKHIRVRQQKCRKKLNGPVGNVYDLNAVFDAVNTEYFGGKIEKPTLSWSLKRNRRTLGYHDFHLNLIVLSKALDHKKVPFMVVKYVMYHELLHTVLGAEYRNGKRMCHTKEFRQYEKAFKQYATVKQWLLDW